MAVKVIGAGVGRTGTHSLKVALERLLGGRCHHMVEIIAEPSQAAGWTDAVQGRDVDWQQILDGYDAVVDWPGASFWKEISAANPDALVLLSTRDPESWYRSASNTIFTPIQAAPPGLEEWFGVTMPQLLGERFCADRENAAAMIAAFEAHNAAVRAGVPAERLLEWTVADGWEPICARLGVEVPDEPFPLTNTTAETRELLGMPALR
ncbi:MAG TPA: sulfotransferase [Solirubrobacteraceae bacterium]|nr:sulfotransferase [Solirubrobacteraceae bacterium]